MSVTFFDDYFDMVPKHKSFSQSKTQRKTEYHGVATAVGKISKRLHTIEEALKEVAEKTPVPDERPTKPIKMPTPPPTPASVVSVPVVVPPEPQPEEGKKIA